MMPYALLREIIETAAEKVYDEREAEAIARLIAEKRYGISRHDLDFNLVHEVEEGDDLNAILTDLAAARPVQYILGSADFYGLELAVGEGVLIPRPETEELVRWVLDDISKRNAADTALISKNRFSSKADGCKTYAPLKVLDVGTGSGAIAIALAKNLPQAQVTAIDVSVKALKFARLNNERTSAGIAILEADALDPAFDPGPQDIIVSNPPYIPAAERAQMHDNVTKYEPETALFVPDDDPLVFYRAVARLARRTLSPQGTLYFEIHSAAADAVVKLLSAEGFRETEIRNDINGKPRMVGCRL